jgi:transglutaminase-like putative cysteine protease
VGRWVVADAKDAASAVRRIVGWVWAHVDKEGGDRGSATALEVLRAKRGDCTEHAVLVVALCRAAGIPARAVSGLEYLSTDGKALAGFHAWAEAWLGRWTPVDATIPEVGTSARYVFIGYDEPGEASRTHVLASLMGRKVRLEVLAWKHAGSERVEASKPEPADAR